jgi:hypothetical protein
VRKIVIVGATSAIAEATARKWARQGNHLFLAARSAEKVEAVAADLRVRGCPKVATYCMDANDFDAHVPMLDAAEEALGGVDTVLIAHGTLPQQKDCERSVEKTMGALQTNALSVIALLTHVGNRFERRGSGTIAVISSVAGDRGRESNYVYGSAKAMVTTFSSGLRQRLHKAGVSVITIKPGFVDTPMTTEFRKGFLWTSPEVVGRAIEKMIARSVSCERYVPAYWGAIMFIIKVIPLRIFLRVRL